MFGRAGKWRAIAALIAALAAAAGFASIAWGVEGDGAQGSGSVVSVEEDRQSEEAAAKESEEAPGRETANDGAPGESPAQGASEEGAPSALSVEGNAINDGQVSDTSFLYDAAIADLAGADSYYDGQTVQVRGEAVGEAIGMDGSPDSVWVVLVDTESGSSVSVVMDRSDADRIDMFGAYGKTGTRLRVQGIYNLACSVHEGESDIHATAVVVEGEGSAHPDRFDLKAFVPGIAAVVVGALCMAAFWHMRERSR